MSVVGMLDLWTRGIYYSKYYGHGRGWGSAREKEK